MRARCVKSIGASLRKGVEYRIELDPMGSEKWVRVRRDDGLMGTFRAEVFKPIVRVKMGRRVVQPGVSTLLKEAVARFDALTPEQQAAHREEQRKSSIRGITTPCEHEVMDFEQCGKCRSKAWDRAGEGYDQ